MFSLFFMVFFPSSLYHSLDPLKEDYNSKGVDASLHDICISTHELIAPQPMQWMTRIQSFSE